MDKQTISDPQERQVPNLTPPVQQPISTKPKILPIVIAVLLSAIVFGFCGYLLGKKSMNSQKTSTQIPVSQLSSTPIPATITITDPILNDLLTLLQKDGFAPVSRDKMWWISDDNWSILVNNAESIGKVLPGAYEELSNSDSNSSQTLATISSFFINQGFTQNLNNSSKDIPLQLDPQNGIYDYVRGFQKGEQRCVITVNPDTSSTLDKNNVLVPDSNIMVSCSNSFKESYAEQIPFVKALNDRHAVVTIEKSNSIAATANIHWRRFGSFALFSKKNGYWEVIFKGQDRPDCTILKQYSFPTDIFDDSYCN